MVQTATPRAHRFAARRAALVVRDKGGAPTGRVIGVPTYLSYTLAPLHPLTWGFRRKCSVDKTDGAARQS